MSWTLPRKVENPVRERHIQELQAEIDNLRDELKASDKRHKEAYNGLLETANQLQARIGDMSNRQSMANMVLNSQIAEIYEKSFGGPEPRVNTNASPKKEAEILRQAPFCTAEDVKRVYKGLAAKDMALQEPRGVLTEEDEGDIFAYLDRRKNMIDSIMASEQAEPLPRYTPKTVEEQHADAKKLYEWLYATKLALQEAKGLPLTGTKHVQLQAFVDAKNERLQQYTVTGETKSTQE